MNNSMKKLLCSVIASGAFFTSLPSFAAIPSDVAGTRYEEPVQILSALNIMNGDENAQFRLDDTIIRSEVAKMAVHAMGLDAAAEASKSQSVFTDVANDHWALGYINVATSLGLIEGDGDGTFRPNDSITYAEAMTIMVRATGYNISAMNKGGFPSGYMSVGTSNGMSKNVVCGQLEPITRGNVAFLTSNALEVPMMEQKGFGTSVSYEVTDKTLLGDKLNVTKADGQITAVEKTSIKGSSSLNKGQVIINDTTYDSKLNLNNLLGYNVTYYVKDSNKADSELILAMPIKSKNASLSIDSEAFSKLTTKNGNDAIVYYNSTSSSSTSTAELGKEPILIYNGKHEDYDKKYLDIKSGSGHINLLDADKDGKYEIVFVTKYENIVVEEVTAAKKVIDKYGSEPLKLDDSVDYTLTNGQNEMKLSELREFDVLTVVKSLDNQLFNITVTRNSVDGTITGTDKDGVYIDRKHYKVASNYTDSLTNGLKGVFYLDAEGRIAAVDTAGRLSTNYAYLTKAYTDKNSDVSSFKVFTREGKERTIEAKDKIKFNDKNGVKASEVVNTLTAEDGTTAQQLITLTVNSDDKITALRTAKDNSGTGAVDKDNFTKNFVLKNAEYSAATSKLDNVRIAQNTLIFEIAEDSKDYSIADKSIFEDKQSYDVTVYDMEENYTAKVIVLTSSSVKATAESSLAVVKNVISAVNSNDEDTEMLEALVDGKEVSVYAENDGILVKGKAKLEEGDLIQYKTNAKGEITSVRVLMDISSKNTEAVTTPVENLKTVYGKVVKKFSDSINVTVNDESAVNYELGDAVVYQIDTTASKNKVTKVSAADIQNYDADENNRIFLRLYKDEVKEAVIIK